MNSKEKYLYSNNTSIPPIDPDMLQQIAGWGNSPIVRYSEPELTFSTGERRDLASGGDARPVADG